MNIFSTPTFSEGSWTVQCVVMEQVNDTVHRLSAMYEVTVFDLDADAPHEDVIAAADLKIEAL